MGGDSIEPGELLWIDPSVCRVPELPDGFVFHVVDLLGWGGEDPRQRRLVWVRGPVLDAKGAPGSILTIRVPVDQRRMTADHRRLGTATVGGGRHRHDAMVGPPPGYTRREFS